MDNSYKYCVYLIYFEDGSVYKEVQTTLKEELKTMNIAVKLNIKISQSI